MPGQLPWYAVKVRTRSEILVGRALTRKSFEIFLPTYVEARHYSDRVKKVPAALFPGYLFCRLDVQTPLTLLKTPGVDHIVPHNDPKPIDELEINNLRLLVTAGADARPWPYLKTGHKVRVEFGSFAGVEGILTAEKGKDRLIVSITILQRSVAVEIDRSWIKPL